MPPSSRAIHHSVCSDAHLMAIAANLLSFSVDFCCLHDESHSDTTICQTLRSPSTGSWNESSNHSGPSSVVANLRDAQNSATSLRRHPLTAMIPATLALAFVFLTLYVIQSIRTFYSLKHFRGHWSTGWSRLWLLRTQGSGQMHKLFTEINNKYGE